MPSFALLIAVGTFVASVTSNKKQTVTSIQAKRFFVWPKRAKKKLPKRMPKTKGYFSELTAQVYVKKECKTLSWGFCVDEIIEDATAAGGAAWVGKMVSWINRITGWDLLTSMLCPRFYWRLRRYAIDESKAGPAANVYALWDPLKISKKDWEARGNPEFTIPKRSGYRRVWMQRGTDDFFAWTLYFPDSMYWVACNTKTGIRRLLRTDKMDLSQMANAQWKSCKKGEGYWRLGSRKKATEIYR